MATTLKRLFGTPANAVASLLMLLVLAWLLPPVFMWAIVDAVWQGSASDCRYAEGACWVVIGEKYRLLAFGRYPYAEHWRPAVGLAGLLLAVAACAAGVIPRRGRWPLVLLALGLFLALMAGGFAALPAVPLEQWGGLVLTVLLSLFGVAGALPLAMLLALGRQSTMPLIRGVCVAYIELIRGVPLVSLLFMASLLLPLFLPDNVNIHQMIRAQAGIILFAAAYVAEVIRGGLQSVPHGQKEAAEALGLGYWQKTRHVVLPQAIGKVIPPLVNVFIGVFKDTSLVAIVGLLDLLLAAKTALADAPWRPYYMEVYGAVGLTYFIFCSAMARYSHYLEQQQQRQVL